MEIEGLFDFDKDKYEKYGKKKYSLRTKMLRYMLLVNKEVKSLKYMDVHRYIPMSSSMVEKLLSDNKETISTKTAYLIAFASANSPKEAYQYLSLWGKLFAREGKKYKDYDEIIQEVCINDKLDGIDRLDKANKLLKEKGYPTIYIEREMKT